MAKDVIFPTYSADVSIYGEHADWNELDAHGAGAAPGVSRGTMPERPFPHLEYDER